MIINNVGRKGAIFGDGIMLRSKAFPISHAFKYRGRVAIISDILKTIRDSSGKWKRKTQIMQSANLNYDQVNKYLALLTSYGYIEAERSEIHRGFIYRATSKGLNFVRFLEAENFRLR